MRWDAQATTRTFDTPEFRGVTFHEIEARSVLNRVPGESRVPFRWTVNPYRGCTHACVYCFARNTHTYLDLDAGLDFDSQVVVKVNVERALRRDLAAPGWRREHVALGTNVDPYQRAEGRYRLMPGIIRALTDFGTPFSILTKGTLVLRDLPLLRAAAERVPVAVNVSVGVHDPALWRSVEPGTPSPTARLGVVRTLVDAGIGCGVLMAPVLPGLSDAPEELERAVRAIAAAGAEHVSGVVLHLRPGAREWYLGWSPASTRTWWTATGSSTAAGRTPRRATSASSVTGSRRWPGGTVWARARPRRPGGPGSPAGVTARMQPLTRRYGPPSSCPCGDDRRVTATASGP